MLGKLLGPDIQEMLFEKRLRELRGALSELPPPDVAELLSDMAENDRAIVFRILPRALASETFEHLSVDDQQSLLAGFNQEQCRRIIQEMDPDDRTALLEELPARVTRKLLRLLSPEDRRITQALLAYPEDSVGRLMTPDYIELRAEMTVSQAIDHIRRVGMTKETVYECYVTLPGHKLEGTIDLKTLVLSQPDAGIKDLMKSPPVAAVNPQQDQEEAALLLQTYDLLALPVIDAERRLIGIITVDDLMDVMAEAADEDIQVMAGVVPETESTYLRQRLLSISWRRGLPMLGLVVVEFIAGLVMRGHHARLQSVLALAYFVPMVMATGGGMGLQTATLVVRGLSTGDIEMRDFFRLLSREIAICLILGLVLGLAAFGLGCVTVLNSPETVPIFKLGLTVGFTLMLVMLLSVTSGTILPFLFSFLKLDPAVMTSPILSTTVDILGLIIYFTVSGFILL